jgi:hypothetical protein
MERNSLRMRDDGRHLGMKNFRHPDRLGYESS